MTNKEEGEQGIRYPGLCAQATIVYWQARETENKRMSTAIKKNFTLFGPIPATVSLICINVKGRRQPTKCEVAQFYAVVQIVFMTADPTQNSLIKMSHQEAVNRRQNTPEQGSGPTASC